MEQPTDDARWVCRATVPLPAARCLLDLRNDPAHASCGWFVPHRAEQVAVLRQAVTELERDLTEALRERDDAQEWADQLAYSISPIEVIGEHSSGNNPWWNALHGEAAE